MQFLHPAMLTLLGLIPVLILIHTLKPKPRPVDVTNLFLWQTVLRERAGQVRFRRLRKNLPLLLQVLIILLVAAALAEPVMTVLAPKTGNIILVIDTSASMKTRLGSGTRFGLAVEKALEILDRQEPPQKALIIDAGRQPNLLTGFLQDPDRAKSLINDLHPSDTPADLEKAVSLAVSFLDPSRDDTVYLITDGAGVDLWRLLRIHPRVVPVIISGGKRNMGITQFAFRTAPDHRQSHEIFLEIKNFSPLPVNCPVRIAVGRTVILETRVAIEGEGKKQMVMPYSGSMTGIVKAVIDVDDAFAVDNSAYAALSATEDIWVLLVSKGNYFLEKLLTAYPNVMVNTVKEITPFSWEEQARRHDIVIVDRMDIPPTRSGNLILIHAFSPSIPAAPTGRTVYPKIVDWDARHPLMAGIDLQGITIEQATEVRAGNRLTPILEASETGLIYTYEKDTLRSVLLAFDITRSDLPLRVAFPVLFSNIIDWFTPHRLGFSALQTRTGESIDLYVAPDTVRLFVRPPEGRWETHPVRSNPVIYSDTNRIGIYTVMEGSRRKSKQFAVNLLNATESDIRSPVIDADVNLPEPAMGIGKKRTGRPMWPFCILLALLLLMTEWVVWLKIG